MDRPLIVCITPVKNEAWILETFLTSASLWADHIIIADQNSDDGSREIALKFPKVKLVNNDCVDFDEPKMRGILFAEVKKISGQKLVIALDADEILSSEALDYQNWHKLFKAKPGTVFGFRWPLISHDFNEFWYTNYEYRYFAFMDCGEGYFGEKIHGPKIPMSDNSILINIDEFVIMHYQFTDWKRMESKHRWYQCYERVNFPKKSPINIYRMYHHMYNKRELMLIPKSWFDGYLEQHINIKGIHIDKIYRWDKLVDEYKRDFGIELFKNIDLLGNDNAILSYLRKTQKYSDLKIIKIVDKILKIFVK